MSASNDIAQALLPALGIDPDWVTGFVLTCNVDGPPTLDVTHVVRVHAPIPVEHIARRYIVRPIERPAS